MKWNDLGKDLRMMSHLGEEMKMISQVTRPQNHSKKKNRAKTNKSKRKRKGPKAKLLQIMTTALQFSVYDMCHCYNNLNSTHTLNMIVYFSLGVGCIDNDDGDVVQKPY